MVGTSQGRPGLLQGIREAQQEASRKRGLQEVVNGYGPTGEEDSVIESDTDNSDNDPDFAPHGRRVKKKKAVAKDKKIKEKKRQEKKIKEKKEQEKTVTEPEPAPLPGSIEYLRLESEKEKMQMLRSLGLAFEGDNNASNRRKKTPAKRTKP
jgi:hypothetical protein